MSNKYSPRERELQSNPLNPCEIMKKDKKSNIIFKDAKEFNIIFLILISLFLVGISGYSSYAIFSDEIISNNEIKGVIKKQSTGAEDLIAKVGTDGLVAQSHSATAQLTATTDYRYKGKNPKNHIKFNNEIWKIIGVFDVDDGTGNIEKRIKIIRDSLGNIAWDGKSGGKYVNDWTQATGMTLLNSGDYWNRTGTYASTGLTSDAKSYIADAKWYLGGKSSYTSASNGLAQHFYSEERGMTVYTGRPTSWTGKVGLMYPSDYGYATGGGTTTNRKSCLAKEMYSWDSSVSEVSDCSNNDWLYDSSKYQWTLTPDSSSSYFAFYVDSDGTVFSNGAVVSAFALRPTVFLSSDIKITGGSGTSASPYEISK